jgi:hypothetical protein
MSTSPGSPEHGAADDDPDVEVFADAFNSFAFNSGRPSRGRRHAHHHDQEQHNLKEMEIPMPSPTPWPTDEPQVAEEEAWQLPEDEQPATQIRAYAWTGGRTRTSYKLELETLVSTTEACQPSRLQRVEHHSIAELCRHPRSMAEVGAVLGVPIGVARVLLGDMADLGLITVHETVAGNGSASHLMLMERVLSGLRNL